VCYAACFIGGLNAGECLDSLFLAQIKQSKVDCNLAITEIGYKRMAKSGLPGEQMIYYLSAKLRREVTSLGITNIASK
jgi:hypothetical protein